MARPIKQGLDYFTYDCFFDDKVELILAEFSAKGIGILTMLWQKIYRTEGYYCCWNDDVALMFSKSCGEGVNVVSEVINACIRRGVFDCEMYKRYSILTSKGIQKRYLEGVTKRKSVEWKNEYLLIDIPENMVNSDNNSVNGNINSINSNNNSQSKVNQSKVNQSKLNKTKVNKSKSNCSSAAAHREALIKEYSKQDRTEMYFDTALTVAEYDYLYHHVTDFELENYLIKVQKYSKCKSAFETIIQWAIADGNYHD